MKWLFKLEIQLNWINFDDFLFFQLNFHFSFFLFFRKNAIKWNWMNFDDLWWICICGSGSRSWWAGGCGCFLPATIYDVIHVDYSIATIRSAFFVRKFHLICMFLTLIQFLFFTPFFSILFIIIFIRLFIWFNSLSYLTSIQFNSYFLLFFNFIY